MPGRSLTHSLTPPDLAAERLREKERERKAAAAAAAAATTTDGLREAASGGGGSDVGAGAAGAEMVGSRDGVGGNAVYVNPKALGLLL